MTAGVEAANDAMIRTFIAAWERRDTEHIVGSFTHQGVSRPRACHA